MPGCKSVAPNHGLCLAHQKSMKKTGDFDLYYVRYTDLEKKNKKWWTVLESNYP